MGVGLKQRIGGPHQISPSYERVTIIFLNLEIGNML